MRTTPLLITLAIFQITFCYCSRQDCSYVDFTEPYKQEDFRNSPISGVYKVSSLSTAVNYKFEQLSNSFLYIIPDTVDEDGVKGNFYFQNFPAWDNNDGKNKLETFYGSWIIVNKPDGMFGFSPSYATEFNDAPALTLMGTLDVRLSNGKPLIVVRVLNEMANDSKLGHTYVYPTHEAKDYCNYLAFEKVRDKIDEDVAQKVEMFFANEN